MKFAIGRMRHRITFQSLTNTADGQGGVTTAWTNLVDSPTVWAQLKPVSSKERLFAQQLQYQRSHVVTIRYRADITQDMRFTYDGRTFQIKGVRENEGKKDFLIIDAEENQGT